MPFHAYASFKGKTQGQFKGESTKGSRQGKWSEVIAFKMGTMAPLDASGGDAAGKRTHPPIVITKIFGSASPQLLTAHASGEMLSEVALEVVETTPSGGERVVNRVTLTNGVISHIDSYVGQLAAKGSPASSFTLNYETISSSLDVQFPPK